jgi:hypothetical protein
MLTDEETLITQVVGDDEMQKYALARRNMIQKLNRRRTQDLKRRDEGSKQGLAKFYYGPEEYVALKLKKNNMVGLAAWPSGFLMCEFVLHNSELFRGKHCVELGAGSGITTIVMARSGVGSITSTDYDPLVLTNLNSNIEANGLKITRSFDQNWAAPRSFSRNDPATITGEFTKTTTRDAEAASNVANNCLLESWEDAVPAYDANKENNTAPQSSCSSAEAMPELSSRPASALINTYCLDWTNFEPADLKLLAPDVVFTCDTVYLKSLHRPLAKVFPS